MPAIAVAAAAWIGEAVTAITTSAAIGAAAANFVAALGFAQGIGAAIGAWATVASIASVAQGPPKVGGAAGMAVQFKADPTAAIPVIVGETGVGGNIEFCTVSGPKNAHLNYLTTLSLGPIAAIVGFQANNVALTFNSGSDFSVIGSSYSGKMWQKNDLGALTPADFTPPAPSPPVEWTSPAHRLTGLAKSWWVLAYDQTDYPSGTPKPLWICQGVACYDPRLDSTYPGGSGPQRWNDETTWAYSANPALHALSFCIGRKQNGKRVTGLGAPITAIDVAAFVEAANVADANGWVLGGQYLTTDPKANVLAAMLACCAAWPVSLGATISCGIDTPRVSIATLTGDDAAGAVALSGVQPRRTRINGVVPSYVSAADGYQVVPAALVSVASYVTADGEEKNSPITYSLCPNVDQAAQLARYAIEDSREAGPFVVPCKPRWMGYRPNDCITLDEPEWNVSALKCIILKRDRDPSTGIVTLTLRSETDAKHPFALGQTGTAMTPPALTAFNPSFLDPPDVGSFAATGGTLTSAAGAIPALIVTGSNDNAHAGEVQVQYRPHGGSTWVDAPPVAAGAVGTSLRIEITGVTSGAQYDVQVGYISVRGVASAFTSLGSPTAGSFSLSIYDAAISDGVLTPAEKLTLDPLVNALINGRAKLRTAADAAGLTVASGNTDRANYEAACTNLDSYLATLTSPVAWNVLTGNTTISSPSTFQTRLQDAGSFETALQGAVDAASLTLINSAIADGVLTPAEKLTVIPIVNALINARATLRTQADAVGLTVASGNATRSAYETACSTLDAYLATLTSPVAWNVTTGNTTISSPSTFRTNVQNQQTDETNLQTAIDQAAQGLANMPGANLVFDGGFSLRAQRWTVAAGWSWAQDVTMGPVLFSNTNGTNLNVSPEFGVAAGEPYMLSAKMLGVGIAAGAVNADVEWRNSSHAVISRSTALAALNDGNPHYLSQPVTSPAGAAFAVVRLYTNAVTFSSGAFWCQGVKLALGTTVTPWSDETTSSYLATQYVDPSLGIINNWRALPNNVVLPAAFRTAWPLTATDTTITVNGASASLTLPGGTLSVPTGTISGLTASTLYDVYYDMTGGGCVAVLASASAANLPSISRYLFIGRITTAVSGGGSFPSPPVSPPGAIGGGGGDPHFQEP